MEKNRLLAFSDGVIAIIIRIMVLELKVPHDATLDALVAVTPAAGTYVAFGLRRHRSRDGLMPDASSVSRLDHTKANARPQLRQAPTTRSNASGCLSRPPIRGGQNELVSA
jgi:hypothetical protein